MRNAGPTLNKLISKETVGVVARSRAREAGAVKRAIHFKSLWLHPPKPSESNDTSNQVMGPPEATMGDTTLAQDLDRPTLNSGETPQKPEDTTMVDKSSDETALSSTGDRPPISWFNPTLNSERASGDTKIGASRHIDRPKTSIASRIAKKTKSNLPSR